MIKQIIVICSIFLFANISIAATSTFKNVMEDCTTGTYFDGALKLKQGGNYCLMQIIYNHGMSGQRIKTCRFPLSRYKDLIKDSKEMESLDFNLKYQGLDVKYCKWGN